MREYIDDKIYGEMWGMKIRINNELADGELKTG